MKIADVQTFLVDTKGLISWVFVKVTTDEGLVGYGEAGIAFRERALAASIQELKPLLVGRDPFAIRPFWGEVYKSHLDVRGPSSLHVSALGAIEVALWDIAGKALGVPVYNLLGGKCRDRVRAYLHAQVWGGTTEPGPEVYVELAQARVAEGFRTIKFDPFWFATSSDANIGRDELRRVVRIVGAVRKAVGDDVDLLIEAHDRFSVSTAIRVGQQIEEYRPMWLETPVMSTDIEATLQVARSIKVPVATGERFNRLGQFMQLLAGRAVDIVQPETLSVGGIGGARKAAALAEAAEAFVALHQAQSPYNTAINAHLHASIPNFLIQECFDDFLEPWTRELMRGVPRVKAGYLEPSDAPGIGVEFDEQEMAKHPYGPNNFLRLFENGWEKRTFGVRK